MENYYLLGFSLIPGFGPAKLRRIKHHFPSIEAAWKSSDRRDFYAAGISEKHTAALFSCRTSIDLDAAWAVVEQEEIQVITPDHEAYPPLLGEITSAPFLLLCRGKVSLLRQKQIAVVGSRRPSEYGKQVTEKLIPGICQSGLIITSGLAQGIDQMAHRQALECHGQTIAVMGSGINDRVLTRTEQTRFAYEILDKGGLIISEYPPDFQANKITFPARNRIISGLSLAVLVIEAGHKSGSLITARHALEQNREVLAVPGPIFSSTSAGTNHLIRSGAKVVTSANDILECLQFSPTAEVQQRIPEFLDETEKKIYQLLSYEALPADVIVRKIALTPSETNMKLSMMELRGLIKAMAGGFIRL